MEAVTKSGILESHNELLEGFSLWQPEFEEKEECIARLRHHIYRVLRDNGTLQQLAHDPLEKLDINNFVDHIIEKTALWTDSHSYGSTEEERILRNNIGSKMRNAFDTVTQDILARATSAKKLSEEHQQKTMSKIDEMLFIDKLRYSYGNTKESKSNYFQNFSTTDRAFFDEEPYPRASGSKREAVRILDSLAEKLFALPFATEEGMKYLQAHINGSRIALIGGGHSMHDLLMHTELTPEKVVNIDTYLEKESVSRAKGSPYKSVLLSGLDPQLSEKLGEEGEGQFDEIWCTHSLPHYIENPEDFNLFFQNIATVLKKGGICRIYPVLLYSMTDFDDEKDEARRQAFLSALKEMMNNDLYNVAISDNLYDPNAKGKKERAGKHALITIRRIL